MADLRDLLPLVIEKCSGIPNQLARDQLKKSYRNFCLKSGYVQQTNTVDVNADGSVKLKPKFDHYIGSINIVEDVDGRELVKGTSYKVDTSNKVTIADGYSKVVITYSIIPELPMQDDFYANDDVVRRWPDELAAGAASLLRIMPKQSWTDVELSHFYDKEFTKGHREAYQMRVASNDENQLQSNSNREFF